MKKEPTAFDILIEAQNNFFENNRLSDFVFFYDESNNFRNVKIDSKSLKNDIVNKYFILSGIAIEDDKLDVLDKFINIIPEQERNGEKKFAYFAKHKTDFKEVIKSDRIYNVLNFLNKNNIYIHTCTFNYLYWNLIDLCDALLPLLFQRDPNASLTFKNDFFNVLSKDLNKLMDIFKEYDYPQIEKENTKPFLNKILKLYKDNLNQLISEEKVSNSQFLLLLILEDSISRFDERIDYNDKGILCNDLYNVYMNQMCIIQGVKYFDKELDIMSKLKAIDENYEKKTNTHFLDSKESIGIMLSDFMCGFLNKLMEFISISTDKELSEYINSLNTNDLSYKNLMLFLSIFDRSVNLSPFMVTRTIPIHIEQKAQIFFANLRKKNKEKGQCLKR